ncbi:MULTISPECIES: 5'-methylthioadenosine/adenosylhomocysteine nucleosidase [unclassified Caballeronia]|uniref:5'-methylthioadenosine/adenosylhomocysteine nucleosidase n=1 Tax=unclassified Caballeronia TaxID=2646786 RepID=UPI002864F3E6|nr:MULTISPECIES: 5'-methylthioadenosine/adenosylhomocysteine nucleosidase [unclassified Caballeronia]MDR5772020.1 5'-methylthioadenosine/adenosylhomocysteine nucleosidase [Caballeronia sp. LZ002]MDR5847454.1 5'-methylthioadenosine/adenosylhomocysteine nucleosidase [Caballeronia sp. LZ003]
MTMLGIMAALPQELGDLVAQMHAAGAVETVTLGQREYHVGHAHGVRVVATLARIGKVAAAATASALIHVFKVDAIVFTGVAGGVHANVRVGDIVIGDTLLQHDLDASPLFPRYEVPLLARSHFAADPNFSDALALAAASFIVDEGSALAERFAVHAPRVHRGLIVSGDRFVASNEGVLALRDALPDALAVEMEGAALAQVCFEHAVPCAVVRTISDSADAAAPESFAEFLVAIAGAYSSGILVRFLRSVH